MFVCFLVCPKHILHNVTQKNKQGSVFDPTQRDCKGKMKGGIG